jgi:hypothetical protein
MVGKLEDLVHWIFWFVYLRQLIFPSPLHIFNIKREETLCLMFCSFV